MGSTSAAPPDCAEKGEVGSFPRACPLLTIDSPSKCKETGGSANLWIDWKLAGMLSTGDDGTYACSDTDDYVIERGSVRVQETT